MPQIALALALGVYPAPCQAFAPSWLQNSVQNVMAITDVLALFWQSPDSQKRDTAMKKIAAILALAFALTIGMTLTTAFAFSLLPLVLA